MPKFAGDVREYAIFRSDFKHTIESIYSKTDAITFFRSCLQDKPLALIKRIGSEYGDPGFVSDTITQDIAKFRSLQPGKDARFCDLVHLDNRSYNATKGSPKPKRHVTLDMVKKLAVKTSTKSCDLDPLPASVLRTCRFRSSYQR